MVEFHLRGAQYLPPIITEIRNAEERLWLNQAKSQTDWCIILVLVKDI